MDLPPPEPGKDEIDLMGEKAIGQAIVISLSGLSKIQIFSVSMELVDSNFSKRTSRPGVGRTHQIIIIFIGRDTPGCSIQKRREITDCRMMMRQ